MSDFIDPPVFDVTAAHDDVFSDATVCLTGALCSGSVSTSMYG